MQVGEAVCSIAKMSGRTGVHMPQRGLAVVDDGRCGCVAPGVLVKDSDVEDGDEVGEVNGSSR